MHLLFITHQGDVAGSTFSISYLADGLARRGHRVYVACRRESLLFRLLADSPAEALPMQFHGRFARQDQQQIRAIVRQYGIQLINAQSSWDRYATILARWRYGLPVRLVHTRRQMPASGLGWLQNLFYHWGTDGVVAVSQPVAKALAGVGMPARHIRVIRNGTPPAKYAHLDAAYTEHLRQHYALGADDWVVGCVARPKRQAQLLEALRHIEHPLTLLLVGQAETPALRNAVARLTVPHRVFFVPHEPPERVLSYYPLLRAKVLPSTMEGLSQSLLEAMALGVPVLATRAAGNPDLITDGENGLLFDDGDTLTLAHQLQRLLEDETLRTQLIAAGKRTALEDFHLDRTLDAYEKYFQELIGREN